VYDDSINFSRIYDEHNNYEYSEDLMDIWKYPNKLSVSTRTIHSLHPTFYSIVMKHLTYIFE